jgi:hypothetical protein
VVVHAGAEEAELGLGVRVAGGEGCEQVVDLGLRLTVRELQVTVEAEVGGDVPEELVDRLRADRLEHLGTVPVSR